MFARFLRLGCLAWGGPFAQLEMIRNEAVERAGWLSKEQFNRALAVYQVLPGPEAHEMCVYVGAVHRGRSGAIAAGLGFMLPGLVLMLILSWLYWSGTLGHVRNIGAMLAGAQVAAVALILRAAWKIGQHGIEDAKQWPIAAVCALGTLAGVHWAWPLIYGAVVNPSLRARRFVMGGAVSAVVLVGAMLTIERPQWPKLGEAQVVEIVRQDAEHHADVATIATSGARAGLLTFGGAYTVVPYLKEDAVEGNAAWISEPAFLNGVAIAAAIPAPLVIVGTFVGFAGAGWIGALVMTAGIFLPSFLFTLIGFERIETLTRAERARGILIGVTAAVVGVIGATAVEMALSTWWGWRGALVGFAALVVLSAVGRRWSVPLVVVGALVAGAFLW
ncbi:MAG: chromate efflux transporter [Planctomycetes bacterium]|nr:chromate efflux transporter [Planctomycetota bacterium]